MPNKSALAFLTGVGGPTPIAIIEPNNILRSAIHGAVARAWPHAESVSCSNGTEALRTLRLQPGGVGLVGLGLPDIDGLDVAETLQRERLVRTLVVITDRRDERTWQRLRELPLGGCFNSHTEPNEALVAALRTIAEGRPWFSADLKSAALTGAREPLSELLTPAELHVCLLIAGGEDEQAVSEKFGIAWDTVHSHLKHAMAKLGVRTRTVLMRELIVRGLVRFGADGRALYPGSEHALAARLSAARVRGNAGVRTRTRSAA